MEEKITTHQAAQIIGVTDEHVRRLLRDGKVEGEQRKRGSRLFWVVLKASAEAYAAGEVKEAK